MGPLNSARHRDKVEGAIAAAAAEGATIVRYSTVPSDARFANGFFTQPALMTGVAATHRVFHEEIFGAALAITPFDDVEEAVALANATEYGLNAGIFTRHIDTAIAVALRVDAAQWRCRSADSSRAGSAAKRASTACSTIRKSRVSPRTSLDELRITARWDEPASRSVPIAWAQ
jgi:hypothetical protein